MAILTLQRRLREVGRLRIGDKGGKNRSPRKLSTFRFTSKDRQVIEAAAERYGGDVAEFDDDLSDDRWQVITKADSLGIVIPPGEAAFSQFFELWSRGGCQRRCDGQTELLSDQPCLCAQETPDPQDWPCKPHTRLSVMLQELPGLGVWRLDSQGYYAATELAGAVDVCAAATARGQMLPARLRLESRSVKRQRGGKTTTLRFVVPVLDVDVTVAGLMQAMGAPAPLEIPEGAAGELPSGNGSPSFTPVDVDALPEDPTPSVADQVKAVDEPSEKPKRSNAQAPLPGSGRSRIKDSGGAAGEHPQDGGSAAGGDGDGSGAAVGEGQASGPSLNVAQRLAMKADDEGIDEETRHVLVSMLTNGRTESGKDVTDDEASALFELYHAFGQGGLELRLHAERSEWFLDDGNGKALVPAVKDGRLAFKVPPRLQPEGASDGGSGTVDSGSAVPDPAALRERAKSLGVNGNKLLGKANRLARERDEDAVPTLDDLESASLGLLAELGDWIEEEGSDE